jgi:hypothetical protein
MHRKGPPVGSWSASGREAGQNHFCILRRALSMAIFRGFKAFSGGFVLLNLHVTGYCGRGQPAVVFDFHVHNESPPSPANDSGARQHSPKSHWMQVMVVTRSVSSMAVRITKADAVSISEAMAPP